MKLHISSISNVRYILTNNSFPFLVPRICLDLSHNFSEIILQLLHITRSIFFSLSDPPTNVQCLWFHNLEMVTSCSRALLQSQDTESLECLKCFEKHLLMYLTQTTKCFCNLLSITSGSVWSLIFGHRNFARRNTYHQLLEDK